jgi:hypothetical protein
MEVPIGLRSIGICGQNKVLALNTTLTSWAGTAPKLCFGLKKAPKRGLMGKNAWKVGLFSID